MNVRLSVFCSVLCCLMLLSVPALSQQPDEATVTEEPDVILAFATGLMQNEDYELAIEEYEKIVEHYPEFPRMDQVLFQLGVASLQTNDIERATSALVRLERDYPASELRQNGLFMLGNAYARQGAPAQAAEKFQRVYESGNELAAQALFLTGANLVTAGDTDEAARKLRLYLEDYPDGERRLQAITILTDLLTRQGKLAEAETLLMKAISNRPDAPGTARLRLLRARLLVALRRTEEAEKLLEDLSRTVEEDVAVAAGLQLGTLLYREDRKQEAGEVFAEIAARADAEALAASALFNAGASFHEATRWEAALRHLSRFVRQYPEHALAGKAGYLAGLSAFNLGDDRQAVGYLTDVPLEELNDQDQAKLINSVTLSHVRRDRPADAAVFCQQVLGSTESAVARQSGYLNLAQARMASDRLKQAIAALDAAAEEFSGTPFEHQAYLQAAAYRYQQADYEQATSYAQRVLDAADAEKGTVTEQARAAAYMRIARCDMMTDSLEDAANGFLTAYQAQPDGPLAAEALFTAAETRRRAGALDEALEYFRQVRAELPGTRFHRRALLGLGMIAVQQERFEDGASLVRDYLAEDEAPEGANSQLARQLLAGALLQQTRPEEAMSVLEKLLAQQGLDAATRASALQSMAVAARQMDQPARAAQYYIEAAAAHERNRASFLFLAGESYRQAEQFESALDAYQRALDAGQQPESARILTQLRMGQCHEELRNYQQAAQHFNNALPSRNLAAYQGVARTQEGLGNYMEAGRTYLKVEAFASDDAVKAQALYQAGLCFNRGGTIEMATKYLERLIERYPDSELAARARQELEALNED